jgi:hypothetical protein
VAEVDLERVVKGLMLGEEVEGKLKKAWREAVEVSCEAPRSEGFGGREKDADLLTLVSRLLTSTNRRSQGPTFLGERWRSRWTSR